MIVENLLLPRFLILELVLACHYFQFTKACHSIVNSSLSGLGEDDEEESSSISATDSCVVDLSQSAWENQPLFLSEERDWIWPGEGERARVKNGDGMLLSCPGSTVNSTSKGTKLINVVCNEGKFQTTNANQVELANHGCKTSPRDSERKRDTPCGPDDATGELIDVGFSVENQFLPIFSVCHNPRTESTYYSEHQLRGGRLQFTNKEAGRPTFKEGKLYYKTVSASSLYSKRHQNLLFSRLLGSEKSKELLSTNFLSRGHLAPDADFVFKEWQDATYYYANAVPQWQSINNGNWKQLEYSVREKAERDGRTLHIRTGALGVMQLRLDTGPKDLWLSSKQNKTLISVPKYLFKTITDMELQQTIAVFSVNNPLLARVTRSTILCKDICDQTGWGDQLLQRDQVDKGVLFCCAPDELVRILPWSDLALLGHHSPLHF